MATEKNNYIDIFRGRYQQGFFKDRYKTVKIFLSSTFTGAFKQINHEHNFQLLFLDTHEERDYLIANIYPKLKDYCKKEYGKDFQV